MIEIRRKAGVWTYEGGERVKMPQDVLCIIDADTLAGADLRSESLAMADLSGRDLRGADLTGLTVHGTDFRGADLRGASLSRAGLTGASFGGALMKGTDFTGADFMWARLHGADLRGAILADARHLHSCHYDDDTSWPDGMERPYAPDSAVRSVSRMIAAGLSPDEYAAHHGRNTLVFSYGSLHFREPATQAWVQRFAAIIFDDALLRECEERYLPPEEVERIRRLAEEDQNE